MGEWFKLRWLGVALVGVHSLAGCVGSELEAPASHPGHPQARHGKVMMSTALGPELDVRVEQDEGADSHAGHGDHSGHQHEPETAPEAPSAPSQPAGASATYSCPMHPEIVREEPGKCPVCGMKLVPKKGAK
jgi:membrane fusion protein, copper/silver efflux system